jgi:DNA-binding MarR family transcriptional regulator
MRTAVVETELGAQPGDLAVQMCEMLTQLCLTAPRGRRRAGDLKEVEFLTLSILNHHRSLIVGDIQRQLGVLPAQMSRVIRSLENRERPLIACQINAADKRKINVTLTPAGAEAFRDHQAARVGDLCRVLNRLPEEDRDELERLLAKVRDLFGSSNS